MRTLVPVLVLSVAAASVIGAAPSVAAQPLSVALQRVSHDPYTDAKAQHNTEVEPDTFSYGNTIVSVFQVGRVSTGGASNIGWATSSDGGSTWSHGYLPGTTTNVSGKYQEVSDASIAYDAKRGFWLVSYLGLLNSNTVDVLVSRSATGLSWSKPIAVAANSTFYDKNWTVCDDTATSPHYGNCYTEYDGVNAGDAEHMKTSTDGGATWGAQASPADGAHGLGGQPLVAPSGRVIVPFLSVDVDQERAFSSTNGGASWSASVEIAPVQHHPVSGLEDVSGVRPNDELRESPLPSAEIDGAGRVYVAWSDCSFRASCASNDIVISTSTDGAHWSAPARVPIDPVTSTVDHFTPGIGVDPTSSGSTARVALTYYFYPKADCTDATCALEVGYVSSGDGGATWTTPRTLAGPMQLDRLPQTTQGRMFGDYISTSVLPGGNAYPIFPVARKPINAAFNVAMYVPIGGLPVG